MMVRPSALIHDLRALKLAKRTAWQTTVKIVTTGFVLALLAWAGIKLKLMGDW